MKDMLLKPPRGFAETRLPRHTNGPEQTHQVRRNKHRIKRIGRGEGRRGRGRGGERAYAGYERRRNRTAYGPRTVQTEAPAGTVGIGILGNGGPHSIIPSYKRSPAKLSAAGISPSLPSFSIPPHPSIAHTNQHMCLFFLPPLTPSQSPTCILYWSGLDPTLASPRLDVTLRCAGPSTL